VHFVGLEHTGRLCGGRCTGMIWVPRVEYAVPGTDCSPVPWFVYTELRSTSLYKELRLFVLKCLMMNCCRQSHCSKVSIAHNVAVVGQATSIVRALTFDSQSGTTLRLGVSRWDLGP